jgi:16S rRNA (cytidine1402-2'-O)-methyltransferase
VTVVTTPSASLLLSAAHAAAGGQQYPVGSLYVVATPIGNLADLTLRAIHVLSLVDGIACEDTRHSAALMRHLSLDKPLFALHEHNEREATVAVLDRLARGQRIALVSDAGTPAISDPGAVLVAEVQQQGYRTIPLPGASSAAAAVSVAGDSHTQGFGFVGFLPARGLERAQALAVATSSPQAQVFFEAPHRIEAWARELAAAVPERRVTVCRELTKQFESVTTLPLAGLSAWLAEDPNRRRGEFVLVLHAPESTPDMSDDVSRHDTALRTLMAELPLKQAVSLAAELTGASRKMLYARALALKGSAL